MHDQIVQHPVRERLAAMLVRGAAIGILLAFGWMATDIIVRGMGAISLEFLFHAPRNAGRDGGIGPLIVSTALIVGICVAVALPLGLGAALYLAEIARRDTRVSALVRGSIDILAAVPSIVFGLFGNAFFAIVLGLGFSIVSGGLTLACMILPILIRTIEVGLRSVPQEQRDAAAGLSFSQTTTLRKIVLPHAAPAIATGLILGIGRAIAETAALIFTSGYVARMPESVFDSGRALSVHIYDLAMNVPGGNQNAYGTALVLIVLILLINQATWWISKRFEHDHD